jgi:site-specific DNA recombinase
VFATDEPIDAQAPEASTILVRRMKQGMAEFFRYNLKAQMWEGLKEYAISGHNTGRCPYGYLEDRTPHPSPMKASMGATRARLVADPERGPWVTRIYQWRVYEKLDCNGIARRLTELGAPSRDGGPWDYGTVYGILRNPKYTGKIVIGRTRNTGESRSPGQRKTRAVPREHWTWAGDGNEHPALVPMDLWEAAQEIGHERSNVRDHAAPPTGQHLYPLRSRITCAQCQRRMCGLTAPGTSRSYYVCPHNPNSPRHAARNPDHVRAAFRDHVIYGAVDGILTGLLTHDRAATLAAHIPATQAADASAAHQAEQLCRRIDQAEAFMKGLIAQLGHLGDRQDPAARAQRDRIDQHFTTRYDEQAAAKAELEALTASQPVAEDPALIDELPFAPALLADAPADIRAHVYAAFQVQALYRADQHQATIRATITDQTPGIIQALLTDPRTDHDTADPARTNSPSAL